MKFTLSKTTSQSVLAQALKTCNIKAKGEADSEFLIFYNQGDLFIRSVNDTAEQTIKLRAHEIDAQNGDAFSVSGQALVEFLKQFPDEDIVCTYQSDTGALMLNSTVRKTRVALPTGDPNDFIPINFVPVGKPFSMDAEILARALRCTSFATSTDYAKMPFVAVKLQIENDKFKAESTDETRISVFQTEIENVGANGEYLLPRETADSLASMFEHVDTVEIQSGQHHLRLTWEGTVFTSSLVSSPKPFPNLSTYLEQDKQGRVKVSRGDLLRALKMAALVAKDSSVQASITNDGLLLTTNERTGASQDVVPSQERDGDGKTYMSCKLFTKAVESTSGAWLEVEFSDLGQDIVAVVVRDEDYQHLMFPVQPKSLDENEEADPEEE
jgi:DNA polymerase III sliding clamp (beta) subunit (PCNA family)